MEDEPEENHEEETTEEKLVNDFIEENIEEFGQDMKREEFIENVDIDTIIELEKEFGRLRIKKIDTYLQIRGIPLKEKNGLDI